jgi:PAS domain S-box-containing protein
LSENKTEESFTALSNLIAEPVMILDSRGIVRAANNFMNEITGFSSAEMVGKNFRDAGFFDPETKAVLAKNLEKRLKGEEIEPYEIKILAKNGETEYIEVKGKIISYAGELVDLVVFHDVTQRKKVQKTLQTGLDSKINSLRKTEDNLRDSEEKLRAIVEASPDPIAVSSSDAIIIDCNLAALKTFGCIAKSEVIGRNVFDFFAEENRAKAMERLAGKEEVRNEEYIFQTKDGREFPGELSTNVISQPSGEAKWFVSVVRDVTERKKAEGALRLSEERFRSVLNNSLDIIYRLNVQTGRYEYWSPSCRLILGFEPEELMKMSNAEMLSRVHPEDLPSLRAELARIDEAGKGFFEYRFLRKDGTYIWWLNHIVATKDASGKPLYRDGYGRDITESKKAEAALRDSEEKFRNLAEQSPNIIFINQKGRVVYANKQAEEAMGYKKEEFYSPEFNFLSLIAPESIESVKSHFIKHIKNEGLGPYEYKLVRKDGTTIDAINNARMINYNGGPALLGVVTDITESKKLSDALTESEKKFRAICNSVRDAIILVDDQAKVTYWNPAAEKTFGFASTEAIGRDIHELMVPSSISEEEKTRIRKRVKSLAETSIGHFIHGTIEVKGRRKNGGEFPAESSISPVKLGGKWGAVAIVRDITNRKKAEQTLREAEQRYHALFDQAPIGILVVDPETVAFVEFNDVACKQLGYSREEFAGLTVAKIEAQETVDDVKSHAAQMVKEGGGEFETKHRTKDGEIRSVLVSTKTVELAGKALLHCIFHDITEIRRVQDALMESETRYRQLVELAQEGVWVLDKEYDTTFVNRRMAQMMGYVESEMVGKSLFEFVDKKHVDQAKQVLGKYLQGVRGEFEYEFLRKDGSRVYTSIAASQVTDDQGHYLGTLALVADITLRKQMADKLEQYSKNLEELVAQRTKQLAEAQAQLVKAERLAAIGELAGMVGHDLRNPLTGIKNAVYLLEKKDTEIPAEQSRAMLKTIDRCVDHSNRIINDLLDYSRDIHLVRRESSPIMLLSEVLAITQIPRKVKILNHLANEPSLKIDPDKMERVFINLIKNAFDAMPNGGTVTIKSKEVNGSIQISVTDTGTGIPDEILPKLFSPLVTTKAQGMGFGLAICKRIVDAHEGTITVETAKGKGTTFTVTLPIEPKLEVGGEKFWIKMPESSLLTTTKAQKTQ